MPILKLILAHFIADYLLQPKSLVAKKYASKLGIFLHASIHFACSLIIFLSTNSLTVTTFFLIITISVLHFFIDNFKIRSEVGKTNYSFYYWFDQFLHLATITIFSFILIPADELLSVKSLNQALIILYFILSIFVTLTIEIGRAQTLRKPNTGFAIKFNHYDMFMRWLIFTVIFTIFSLQT